MPKPSAPAVQAATDHVFIGRQPIMEGNREVFAYELLYRDEQARGASGSIATSRVLIHSLVNIGLDSIVGGCPAFINATEQLLMGPEIELFPPDRVVFEILETVKPSVALAERIALLKSAGFCFALDDFVYSRRWDALLDQVQFVKVDVQATPIESVDQLTALRRPGIRLVAEKVETYEEFQRYLALGFELFQGYFFCRPETLSGRAPASNKLTMIRVLGKLCDQIVDTAALAKVISEDGPLCYQLLRLANSAALSRKRTVETIEDAVVRVGLDNIRHWVSLLLLTQEQGRKPHELLFTGMARARMCELLAQRDGLATTGACFVAGLLSIADALLDRPFPELIASMPLSPQLLEALLERRNDIGKRLGEVLSYERMLADGGTIRPGDVHLDRLRSIYFESLEWARQLESRAAGD